MKTRYVLAALFLAALVGTRAFASIELTIDEYGDGSGIHTASGDPFPLAVDSTTPLTYSLFVDGAIFTGNVGIYDTNGILSGLVVFDRSIRFDAEVLSITFYSGDSLGSFADVGPAGLAALVLTHPFTVSATEDSSGLATYIPKVDLSDINVPLGEPGFVFNLGAPTEMIYHFQRDVQTVASVPEPSTVIVWTLGGLVCVACTWLRRKAFSSRNVDQT